MEKAYVWRIEFQYMNIYYCDMTPERRKCAVREAPQRRPLLDNGSLGAFHQQQINA
jgi:hypothetical protein